MTERHVGPGREPPPAEAVLGAPDLLDTPAAGPAALRGSALRTAGYVLALVLSLAAAPLLIRHLGQVRFGRYITVISLVTVVSGLTEGGINAIALRELATLTGARRAELMRDMLGLRLILSVIGVGIAITFAAVAGYGSTLVLGTLLAGIGMVLQVTQTLLAVPLQAELRFGWASVVDLVRQVVNVALLVTLVVVGADVLGFLAVAIPASLVALVMTAILVRRLVPLRPRFAPGTWWPILRDTIPFAVAIALNAVYFRVTIIAMSLVATAEQTGYFSTSFRVMEVLIGVPGLVIGAAFPILARAVRDDRDRFSAASGRLFELGLLVGSLMAMGLWLGAGFAIDVLGGREAHPAAAVLRIQSVAMIATFVAVACGYPLLSLRRNREILIANALALAASIILTVILVPPLEARGAAIAAVSAEVALAITTAALLIRSDSHVRLPLSAVPIALGAGLLGAAAGHAVPVHPLLQVVVGTVVFVAIVALAGRFPPEIQHALARHRPDGAQAGA